MSVLGRSDTPVGQPTRRCAATGQPLETGTPCVATLVRVRTEDGDAESEVVRRDYSPAQWPGAWEPDRRPADSIELIAVWRTRVPEPKAGSFRVIEDAEALDLFEQLDGSDDDTRRAIRFVLTLLLVRRRLLVCTKTDPRTGAMTVKRRGPEAEEIVVDDPGLDEARITATIDELGALLGDAEDSSA